MWNLHVFNKRCCCCCCCCCDGIAWQHLMSLISRVKNFESWLPVNFAMKSNLSLLGLEWFWVHFSVLYRLWRTVIFYRLFCIIIISFKAFILSYSNGSFVALWFWEALVFETLLKLQTVTQMDCMVSPSVCKTCSCSYSLTKPYIIIIIIWVCP